MLNCRQLSEVFIKNGLTYFSGVPDSTFKDWMAFLADNSGKSLTNRIAVNECEAIANCAGYHLATKKTGVAYMQNSGFGKTINPLTSLVSDEVYAIPVALMIGWRGEPGKKDEPQHKTMGRVMLPLLDALGIPYKFLPPDISAAEEVIQWAKESAEKRRYASAIIVKEGLLESYVSSTAGEKILEMSREDAIKFILDSLQKGEAVVSTTGKISRELFECRKSRGEEPRDFLTVGSMGCSSSIASEIALQHPSRQIYCFDGDGAALMQLGALATIGHYKPSNLRHIIFDNESHDSTGGQPTVSSTVDFAKIALACGYNSAAQVETREMLAQAIREIRGKKGPTLLVIKVKKGARKDLGRPTSTPVENKKAFMDFLNEQ